MHALVFLLDVDDTLLDNDRFGGDLRERLRHEFGAEGCARYREIYERIRGERGYADYLEALQQFRAGREGDSALLRMSGFVLDYPFADRLYPGALDALAHLATLGLTVILSDGDVVFQPRKIQRSGLWDAVGGRVLVTVHKQDQTRMVQRIHPARHYVMVDDKPDVLASMKTALGERMTTLWVRQGHYAAASGAGEISPAPDIAVERIADLCTLDDERLTHG